MKNKNQHTDRIIKRKIKKYEFEFSDHAWDKMEAMMDSPPSSSRSNHFFNLRNLLLMILLLVILTLGVFGTINPALQVSTAQLSTFPIIEKTNNITTATNDDQAVLTDSDTTPMDHEGANQQTIKAINTLKIFPFGGTPFRLLPIIPVEDIKRDTSLQQRLERKIAEYNEHYSPEKVYLHLDRKFFNPGESIWFSAYLRDANTLQASTQSDILHVELLAPNGGVMQRLALISKNGQVKGDFALPAGAVGGMYKIKAYTNWQKNTGESFERDIQVQKSVLPNLRMTAEFVRKAYGPGDQVEVDLALKTLENTVLANHTYEAVATVAGKALPAFKGKTLADGKAKIVFKLPKELSSNDGLLNVMIEYQGQVESISRSIPIVLNKIDLQLLPEGGDMVAGIPTKVAFKAINEFGKPADIEGKVYNSSGVEITDFRSYHQGMGTFSMIPKAGEGYYAKITKPEGLAKEYALPVPLERGYGLKASPQQGDHVKITVHSTEAEALTVVLQSHGDIHEVLTTPAKRGSHHFTLPVKDLPIGVAALTLFDSKEIPRSERLVFLNPDKKLDIRIKADKEQYLPREKVKMSIEVKDERGMPMPGKFSLAVADDNLLTFADDKQGGILAYMLLESELKGEIEEPDFYFEPKEKHLEKDQLLALDYLMLTQGWRRLNWMEMEEQPLANMSFPNEKAVLAGQVVNYNNQPLAEVEVSIPGTLLQTKTNGSGHFLLSGVELDKGSVLVNYKNEKSSQHRRYYNYSQAVKVKLDGSPANTMELARVKSQKGSFLKGQVVDYQTGEPLIYANLFLEEANAGTTTDFDGKFTFKNVQPGKYNLQVQYVGFQDLKHPVEVNANEGLVATLKMSQGMQLLESVVVTEYKVPLVEQDNTTSGQTITSEQIRNLPTRNVTAVAATAAGLSQQDDGDAVTIRGSRAEATDYYIDGIRVRETGTLIPQAKTEILSGTPASAAPEPIILFKQEEELEPVADEKEADIVFDFNDATKDDMGRNQTQQMRKKALKENTYGYTANNLSQRFYHVGRTFYSPEYKSGEKVKVRNDFRSTVYWNPEIRVGRNGKAEIEFFTTDALTTFRASIEGLTDDGGIGAQTHFFHSQQPVGMKVKIPSMLLTGDEVTIPLTLSNHTKNSIDGFLEILAPKGFQRIDQQKLNQRLKANQTKTVYLKYKAEKPIQNDQIAIAFNTENGFQDAFSQPVRVLSRGFPVDEVYAANALENTFTVNINRSIEGTLKATFATYPSVLDDLVSGLDRMLRQPNGCFEQTSSSNYPNVLVMDYLRSTGTIDRKTEKRAMGFLDHGYKRLLTFEVKGGGFDWYGRPPAHESLTAYGLMEFVDMAEVYDVDPDLIDRTAKWLLSRKDGKGGWKKGKPDGHRWETQNPVADAYTTWALVEAGFGKKVKAELEKSYQDALETEDPYIMALVANSLIKIKDQRAKGLMEQLLSLQAENGSWDGKTFSMTHSRGKSLTIETTALATLAVLQFDQTNPAVQKAIDFILSSKSSYGFGSTQSTVLAMKVLVEYAKNVKSTEEGGALIVQINGKTVINEKYTKGEKLTFADLAPYFKDGVNEVKVKFKNTTKAVPYDLNVSYSTAQPNNDEECKVAINTVLQKSNTSLGNTVRLSTSLENKADEVILNPIAKVGIPAGLSAQPWQLKELQEKGVFDFYEISEGYVVFYFRGMKGNAVKTIDLDLKADVPGTYEAPASLAYLYYTNEFQHWSKPERLVVSE